MIAKLIQGFSKHVLGEEANQAFHPLPQLPTLGVSRQAVEKMYNNNGVVSDEDVANIGILKTNSDKAAKNAKRYSADTIAIANNEIAIADAYEKARQAAEKSQVKQRQTQAVGHQKTQDLIGQATDAIEAAGRDSK